MGSGKGAGNKKQKKGGNQQEVRDVSEATRIRIARILEQFRNSDEKVYKFEDNLTKKERAAVHVLCRKMGMKSKSAGWGVRRRISVYKIIKGLGSGKGKDNLISFRFLEEAKYSLQDLFSLYPPDEVEMTEKKIGESSRNDNAPTVRDDMFSKPTITQSEMTKTMESLASRIEKDPNLRQITEKRSKLPIASFRDAITSAVASHQVVLICGETGCGKTTQVPQFLLDHEWSKGEKCKIVCTQPRRISATSVAERIASERGEDIGDSVGYKIRLESKGGKNSSLVLCTNGVLLRVLVSKASDRLKKKACKKRPDGLFLTHIIVDEIHERDRFSDFMLAVIREMLPIYTHLRLVLMSATMDAERFSAYFGGCPIIRVPGFTYPVKSFYLEDILSIVKSTENNHLERSEHNEAMEDASLPEESRVSLDEVIDSALSNDEFDPLLELISSEGNPKVFNYQHSLTGATPLMVFAAKGRVGDICMLLTFGVDCHLRSKDGKTALDYAAQENHAEAAQIIKKHMEKTFTGSDEDQSLLDTYLSKVNPELVDCVLIEQLLRRICSDSNDGAILIFLPGWDDINRTREKLLAGPFFKDPSKFDIIALHSRIPSAEQKKVFQRPPPGCRKIVLSTNIAETSVTIEDVVYVVDSGRMKEKSYDPYHNVTTLCSSWISKANAKQRQGRAGRCQPGICYHLYSKVRAASLPDFQVPEIQRMPIEELCLQVKLMDPSCKMEDFLNKTMDPPVPETIHNAITVLQDIGAISPDEKLTELGEKLGTLPVHPRTSKMLFLSILLNCLDPALTLACAADHKEPFSLPMLPDQKKKAQAAKLELASLYGGNGDQLAIIAAFECWRRAKEKGDESKFCSQYFISPGTMRMLRGKRKQLEAELRRHGFIPDEASRCSLNAQNPGIVHAVVVAGMYPMVGRVVPVGRRCLLETVDGIKVRIHQHSTNAMLSSKKHNVQPLVVFHEITRGDGGLYIRNCSIVGSLPLLLLATEIEVAPATENDDEDEESDLEDAETSDDDRTEVYGSSNSRHGKKIMSSPDNVVKVVVDRWLSFELTALDVAQIYCLRERLSSAILFKVLHPRDFLPKYLGASLYTIACILSYDGMSGISLPVGPIDSLASMVRATDISQADPGEEMTENQLPKDHGEEMTQNQLPKDYLKSLIRTSFDHAQHVNYTVFLNQRHHPNQYDRKLASNRATVAAYGSGGSKRKFSERRRGNGPR